MHYFLLFQNLGSPAPSWPLLGSRQDRIKYSQLYLMLRSSSLSRACLSLCHCLARIDSTDDWAYLTSAFSQVWLLTQFYSVDFSKSRIGVKKCVFNKRTIKFCVSCC